jgi:N4-(beta-N-acetylglucosaminyl)-L-asparaginase
MQGAAATGDGDQMMRFLPSFAAVGYMRAGDSPTAACAKALQPIAKYYPAASGGLVCLNAQVGRSGALWLTLRPESCSTS